MTEGFESIKRCQFYRDSDHGSMGMGLGFCDMDGFHAICDGDVNFCEKPDLLKNQLTRRKKDIDVGIGTSISITKPDTSSKGIHPYDVLIVDDDPQLRHLIISILSLKGQRCDEACDAIEALKRLEGKRFDAVISDIVMPGMDGITFMNEIIKKYPNISVMIMTGYSEEYSAEIAINSGAREFIKKPFTPTEFLLRFIKMMRENEMFRVIEGKINESEQYIERLKKEIEYLKGRLKTGQG